MGLGCKLCDARCCKDFLITVTVFDVLRLEKATGMGARKFADLVTPSMLRVDWENVVETEDGLFVLALKSHPCVFLRGKECSVFEHAPLSCKLYPWGLERLVGNKCPTPSKVVFAITPPEKELQEKMKEELSAHKHIIKEVSKKKMKKERAFYEILAKGSELLASRPS